MREMKTQKGITLIALIITIVVLLILAVVSINSIQNEGILSYAENAVAEYEQAQENESKWLQGYVNFLENATTSNNTETETTLITFTINGEPYQAKEEMTWAEWFANAEDAPRDDYGIVGDLVGDESRSFGSECIFYVLIVKNFACRIMALDVVTIAEIQTLALRNILELFEISIRFL